MNKYSPMRLLIISFILILIIVGVGWFVSFTLDSNQPTFSLPSGGLLERLGVGGFVSGGRGSLSGGDGSGGDDVERGADSRNEAQQNGSSGTAISSELTNSPPIEITFLGDLMFDRHIRTNAERVGGYDFILAPVEHIWSTSDLVVGNLEAPITENRSVSQNSVVGSPQNFTFTTDKAILSVLTKYPFLAVLGNNHIFNFGTDGIRQTEQYLDQSGINYFGQTGQSTKTSTVVEIKGLKIGFINYNQFVGSTVGGGEVRAFTDLKELSKTTDVQVVYAHWGEEYELVARPVIVDLAHRFVDAGADLVIGGHPHVIQNNEIYANAPIYYSLGNFVFDQYFDNNVRTGLIVVVHLDPKTKEISTEEHKVWMKKGGQTVPFDDKTD